MVNICVSASVTEHLMSPDILVSHYEYYIKDTISVHFSLEIGMLEVGFWVMHTIRDHGENSGSSLYKANETKGYS